MKICECLKNSKFFAFLTKKFKKNDCTDKCNNCVSNPHSYNEGIEKEEAIKDFMVGMVDRLTKLNLYDICYFEFGSFCGAIRCLSVKQQNSQRSKYYLGVERYVEIELYKKQRNVPIKTKLYNKKWRHYYTAKNNKVPSGWRNPIEFVEVLIKDLLLLENTQHLKNWDEYFPKSNPKEGV